MSREISLSSLEQLYSLETESAEIVLLRIYYDNEIMYLARNFVDIDFDSQTYTALPFDITLPNENDDQSNNASISISDVSGEIYAIIRQTDEIKAEFEIISIAANGTKSSIATFQNMRLSSATWEQDKANFVLFREDEGVYAFPKDTMNNILLPGLY